MSKIKLGIVGVGKIARDQHLPVISASSDFELVAAASRNAGVEGVANYTSLEQMLDAEPAIEAVSLCTPPAPREAEADLALRRGLHVLLEKPPATSLGVARELIARANGKTLYASWHSRHAPGVGPACAWLRNQQVKRVKIIWKEDIRLWHPGQDWILAADGMGVFDPGINALSILTEIIESKIVIAAARLEIPANRQSPIAAHFNARTTEGASIEADFDFLNSGRQIWDIAIETSTGEMRLLDGGARVLVDGQETGTHSLGRHHEYHGVYARFSQLIRLGRTDVDLRPLELVADAFSIGERTIVDDFHF